MISATQVTIQLNEDFEQLIKDTLLKQPQARMRLIDKVYYCDVEEKQRALLLKLTQEALEHNPQDDQAKCLLGLWYHTEIPAKYQIATQYYVEAIALGNGDAMGLFGQIYEEAPDDEKFKASACKLYEQGIALGNVFCMLYRGLIYRRESNTLAKKSTITPAEQELIFHNYQRAHELIQRAAGLGYAYAIHMCGIMYAKGNGCTVNTNLAVEYFFQAHKAGYESSFKQLIAMTKWKCFPAEYCLFKAYFLGDGITKNSTLALTYIYAENAALMVNALCDDILSEINKTGQIKASNDFYLLIQENPFLREHHDCGKLALITAKIVLSQQREQEALYIFQKLLADDKDCLCVYDFFQFASVTLNVAAKLTDDKERRLYQEEACELFYEAHIKGDKDARRILITTLRELKDKTSNKDAKSQLYFNSLSEQEAQQLVDDFLIRRHHQRTMKIATTTRKVREQQLDALYVLLTVMDHKKLAERLTEIITILQGDINLDLATVVANIDVQDDLNVSLKKTLTLIVQQINSPKAGLSKIRFFSLNEIALSETVSNSEKFEA